MLEECDLSDSELVREFVREWTVEPGLEDACVDGKSLKEQLDDMIASTMDGVDAV